MRAAREAGSARISSESSRPIFAPISRPQRLEGEEEEEEDEQAEDEQRSGAGGEVPV